MRPFQISAFVLTQPLLFASCAGRAQSAPPTPQATIRTGVNLVLVDVVVTEHDKSVRGLGRSAFHVFEDGREQPLSSFEEHSPASAPQIAARPSLPANTYSNQPKYPGSGAVNVLLLDALNTPLSDQAFVRQKMIKYLGTVKPGAAMAIFALSSQLRMVTDFTTDPAALVAALKSSKAGPQQSALLASEQSGEAAADLANAQQNAQLTAGSSPSNPAPAIAASLGVVAPTPMDAVQALEQFQADQIAFQTEVRMRITLAAMQELAGYLRGMEGRKNVVWFSGSFPLVTFPDSSLFHSFANVSTYRDEIQQTADLLTLSRVAIYPVDSRGLIVPSEFNAAQAAPVPGQALGTQFMNEGAERYNEQASAARYNEQSSMEQVAFETGGQAFVDTNDFDRAVAAAVDNGSSYYTLSYVPPGDRLDGRFHKIEVRVDSGRTFNVACRHGYYADAPAKPSPAGNSQSSALATTMAAGAAVSTGILLTARVLPATDPIFKGVSLPAPPAQNSTSIKGPAHRYIVDLTIDPHGIALTVTPQGEMKTAIELAIVAYGAGGQQFNAFVHGYQININAAQSARVMASGLPMRIPFDLPSGAIDLRIGVRDLNAGRTGSLAIPLHVAE